eukprot:TRINITY_DN13413_c0_g1_i1.p1 TRINITY_DN13413_c0_g1~~TRINITY_DN13413_c0_g1_i1.p1  ORF type:complete len:536 (+),score=126.10 TRINITY_DN13413_c0_g1_i1:74-1681(+)
MAISAIFARRSIKETFNRLYFNNASELYKRGFNQGDMLCKVVRHPDHMHLTSRSFLKVPMARIVSTMTPESPKSTFVSQISGHSVFYAAQPLQKGLHSNMRRSFATSTDFPPHQEIGMPSLSPTMTQGNIAKWRKKEGDKVSPGDVLCEIETDKATIDMESMEEGYIAKIIKGDGSTDIKVGEVIAVMVDEEDDVEKFKDFSVSGDASPEKDQPKKTSSPEPQSTVQTSSTAPPPADKKSTPAEGDRIFASPLARKIAKENEVPLSSIKGTGPDGRIIRENVEAFIASAGRAEQPSVQPLSTYDYTDIPHSQIKKVTASRLLLSKQTIPHYYLTVDTQVDKLMGLRNQLNSLQEAAGGKRISVNDFVIKAAALALRKVPECNSSWTDQFIRQYHNVNISVAVQTENGLFVPVVKDADKKGLSAIAEDVKILAQRAKENTLKPADYEGGTFTVSNLGGPFGIKQFCAIINPPQSAILAVGSAEKRVIPGAQQDEFDTGSFMSVTLSCDHRVIDGAIGAAWLKAFKGYIEDPMTMLL